MNRQDDASKSSKQMRLLFYTHERWGGGGFIVLVVICLWNKFLLKATEVPVNHIVNPVCSGSKFETMELFCLILNRALIAFYLGSF